MDVNVWDFLAGRRPIVYTDLEVDGIEDCCELTLSLCDAFHDGRTRSRRQLRNSLLLLLGNDQRMPRSARIDVEECVPSITLCNL